MADMVAIVRLLYLYALCFSLRCLGCLIWIFCKESVFVYIFLFFHYLLPFPVNEDVYHHYHHYLPKVQ